MIQLDAALVPMVPCLCSKFENIDPIVIQQAGAHPEGIPTSVFQFENIDPVLKIFLLQCL